MPVRHRPGEPDPPAKRCKHCDDSNHSGGSWQLTLDQDLVDTLSDIYPEWFKPQAQQQQQQQTQAQQSQPQQQQPQQQQQQAMAGAAGQPPPAPPPPPPPHQRPPRCSPPKAVVDASPLQQAMDKNKESLKVKLMLRRPLNQLVAQGIMPSLKSPPAFHEQRKQLERAKTGDLLKAKIQKRPDRQELERRHILQQQEGHVDPSLAEKQRMLKKARLADQLNDQLSHRPGPLELIQKNILHTEEPIERAVKEGLVPFKATCEGALRRPEHPSSYQTLDEDSPVEEGSPPLQLALSPPTTLLVTSKPVQFHAVLPTPAISFADLCQSTLLPLAPSPVSITSSTSTLSPLSSAASPPAPVTPRPAPSPLHITQTQIQRSDAPGKDKNRKKSKSKAAPKARTIKFHEYKGPPNAHKTSPPSGIAPQGETSYELLLRQQQLFLQWQLEWQHKYPQIILSAPHVAASPASSAAPDSPESSSSAHPHRIPTPPPPPPPPSGRLEDMKVSDLKAELKRRNLPVSGPKPHLIERLRPFISDTSSPQPSAEESQDKLSNSVESLNHSPVTSPESQAEAMDVESQPPTPQPLNSNVATPSSGEDIVREQQRKIVELQRELHKSQLQLQQMKAQNQGGRQEPPQDARHSRKLALHHLQAKIQSHQLAIHIRQLQELQSMQGQNGNAAAERRQQEHREFQRRHSPGPTLSAPTPPPAAVATTTLSAPKQETPHYVLSSKPMPDQLLQLITTQPGGEPIKMQFTLKDGLNGLNGLNGKNNVGLVLNGVKVVPIAILPTNPPPQYEEVTGNKPPPPPPLPPPPPVVTPAVKSQTVDDVLEILIKNGELPASAAQIPHQNDINHNNEFIGTSELQSQSLNQNISDSEFVNQNQIHEFLKQNNSSSDLITHNNLIENRIHNNLLGQDNILLTHNNMHNNLLEENIPSNHLNESSVLDDLINENSIDSVHQSIADSILSQKDSKDFIPIGNVGKNHVDLTKREINLHDNMFREDHLSNDQQVGCFSNISNKLPNNNKPSSRIKIEMSSHDGIFRDEDMSNDNNFNSQNNKNRMLNEIHSMVSDYNSEKLNNNNLHQVKHENLDHMKINNIFSDSMLSNDRHQILTDFNTLSSHHIDSENSNSMFKSEMMSDDRMSNQMLDNCEMDNNREHGQMDEGFTLDHLLGDDAQDGLDLKELGLDLEGLDSMDFGQSDCATTNHVNGGNEAMDMDEWLDSLWGTEGTPQCDPLLGGPPRASRSAPAPRPPPHFSWDKVDFATT